MITTSQQYAVERIAHAFTLADEIHSTAESLKPWSVKVVLSRQRDYPIDQTALFNGLEDMLLKTKDLLNTHRSFYHKGHWFADRGNGSELGYSSNMENPRNLGRVFDTLQINPNATGIELQHLVTSLGVQVEQHIQNLINQLANVYSENKDHDSLLTTLDVNLEIVKTFMELIAKILKSLFGYIER